MTGPSMTGYAQARHNMVENQLRPSRIVDVRLLAAMAVVPRERFVPETMRRVAYADEDVPLGAGRFLAEPLALAKLMQSAEITGTDRVLVVADLSGYAAAVAARMAATVILLLPPDVDTAPVEKLLLEVGSTNVVVRSGPVPDGAAGQGPFDAIVLVGAVPELPAGLPAQLAVAGRLVAVVEDGHGSRVVVMRSVHGAIGRASSFDAALPPLPGLTLPVRFNF